MGHKKSRGIPRSILRPFTQFLMCFVGWKLPQKLPSFWRGSFAFLLAYIVKRENTKKKKPKKLKKLFLY